MYGILKPKSYLAFAWNLYSYEWALNINDGRNTTLRWELMLVWTNISNRLLQIEQLMFHIDPAHLNFDKEELQ